MTTSDLNFGKGYSYRPAIGIFKDGDLVIDEKTLIAITYWQDFVSGFRGRSGWNNADQ